MGLRHSRSQRAAYERFTDYVISQGARLALITIPPLRADQANLDQLGHADGHHERDRRATTRVR